MSQWQKKEQNSSGINNLLKITAGIAAVGLATYGAVKLGEYHGVFVEDKSCKDNVMTENDDKVVKGVKIHLYTRPIKNKNIIVQVDDNMKASLNETCRHWAMVFYFKNTNRYITHEAYCENDKFLKWECTQFAPLNVPGGKLYRDVATCDVSPKQLFKLASEIKINNMPYNFTLRNCQEWVKLLAKNIGGDVWEYIDLNWKSFYETNPVVGSILGTVAIFVPVEKLQKSCKSNPTIAFTSSKGRPNQKNL